MAEKQLLEESCDDTDQMPKTIPRPLEGGDSIPIEMRKCGDKEAENNDS